MRIAVVIEVVFAAVDAVATRLRESLGEIGATRIALSLVAAVLAAGCGGVMRGDPHVTPNVTSSPRRAADVSGDPVLARLGLPPVRPGARLPGYLMIADRDNNRLIIVSPGKRTVWRFPTGRATGLGAQLSQPDDAFVSADGRFISSNQEFAEAIALITLTRHPGLGVAVWPSGRSGQRPGLLGASRRRRARDRDRRVGRLDAHGRLVWSITTPTDHPSDAQLLPDGNVLVARYTSPGRIDIISPRGRVLWVYGPTSGPGSLDHPSLAQALPNGMIAVTDDLHDRVVLIDRATKRIVWQYGHDGTSGSAPGYLNNPDGLQLVP